MTKHEAAWLSLRVTGLVVALSGLRQFSAFFYLLWMFFTGEMRDMHADLANQFALNAAWPHSLGGAVMLAVATYLLFGGRAFHRVLMNEKTEK